ncbi:MAG: histidine kinase dimerization/phosphoacceptor domain -containing protein [Jannaschia sp.]
MSGPLFRGLRFRIAALLALSLMPIGIVTILQTTELSREVRDRSELTLLSLTDQATSDERRLLERGFGAAEAIATYVLSVGSDQISCSDFMRTYVSRSDQYSFAGFIPPSGIVTCSSAERVIDLSNSDALSRMAQEQTSRVVVIDQPAISGEPIVSISRPVFLSGAFAGTVSLSIPYRYAEQQVDPSNVASQPLSLMLFNRDGESLVEGGGTGAEPSLFMPMNVALSDLVGERSWVFNGKDQTGADRTFATLPVIPDQIYALAVWPADGQTTRVGGVRIPPVLLPLLMVAASISVAYLAVDRLVARPVSDLRRNMRLFASRRILPSPGRRKAQSNELTELEQTFADMAMDLSNDEARMEDVLREKNVLLKEIHHRVKNNLQLISSIMNMQIRAAKQDETISVLRRLQERVLGLATVHRNLYQAENLSRTDAGSLLSDLFHQLVVVGSDAGLDLQYYPDFDGIILFPDQALPLSLLASELGTNAVKNAGPDSDGTMYVAASLKLLEPGLVRLVCENSISSNAVASDDIEGLGTRLIRAFAAQLGGEVQTISDDHRHRVSITFEIESFPDSPEDY